MHRLCTRFHTLLGHRHPDSLSEAVLQGRQQDGVELLSSGTDPAAPEDEVTFLSFTLLRGNLKTQQITQEVRECTWTFSIIFPSSDLNFSDNNGRSLITRAHQLLMEGFNWWHVISSTSRDTADPKTYTTATDQHGKENQAGLLNTTESFPLSPSENIDQTAKNKDILASWDDDDDV
ncbi:hypothetical protein Bca52824_063863 [Brassica carinata]|uniref:Uncharacterized protein n=1 Tax=Brassica carinata TaxID=52824 RepID=A0A8X7QGW0_BRACI|nr:hypothetical protein Bca52824_063863 [Brassica carinata]